MALRKARFALLTAFAVASLASLAACGDASSGRNAESSSGSNEGASSGSNGASSGFNGASSGSVTGSCGGGASKTEIKSGRYVGVAPSAAGKALVVNRDAKTVTRSYTKDGKSVLETWTIK